MTDAATQRQITAADPDRSTWLSANAGSGKTTVLTNRVARLLLSGVPPQNILCLTYTKAAASEMQNRLFQTLGRWAMLDDAALHEALTTLGEPRVSDLSRARTLFARAIDTPGGLKLQTIHSLCASILRQFPLEAGVNPNFREMDAPRQKDLIAEVLAQVAEGGDDSLSKVAQFYSQDLETLALDVAGKADAFQIEKSKSEVFSEFGLPIDVTPKMIARDAISADDIAFLKSLVPLLQLERKKTNVKLADLFDRLPNASSEIGFDALCSGFLTNENELRKRLVVKPASELPEFLPLLPRLETIGRKIQRGKENLLNLAAAEQTLAIQDFSKAFLPSYKAAKANAGLLDFDDLIRHTRKLLTDRSLQWVMYRLDGRIDHILVDEAQDTSPAQWDVIEALAEEMAAGVGDQPRTLFVVGDKKQSIYSFQGADAAGFDNRAERFRERLAGGQGLRPETLEYSFRSSPAILNVVDQVFNADEIAGLGGHHQAYQDALPGRVDLWPLVEKPEITEEKRWSETGDRLIENDASMRLAKAVAKRIKEILETETIPSRNGPKQVEPGDIMVLVQRRSAIFDQIIQACKALELDIAGADRLKLGSELAVRDLLALLSFLALPDDDLSLAAALRSPLFGWSERDLYDLAAKRSEKHLWAALRTKDNQHPETLGMLIELRGMVDFQRPYELLEVILTRFQGRERLLARLGPEAEDGINELLNQALAYERDEVPSLTGFLNRTNAADIEVKRQSDTSGNQIRVMTVHGAKGLESPIVILPETTFQPRERGGELVLLDGMPVFPGRKHENPPTIANARRTKMNAEMEERNRLLYVAMTRAEKWLIVCGTEGGNQDANWHRTIQTGLEGAGAVTLETPFGAGLRYAYGNWPNEPKMLVLETKKHTLPHTLSFGRAEIAQREKKVIAPSDLPGAKALGGDGRGEEEAKQRGRQIHLLLEHLPGAKDPISLAKRLLSHGPDAADESEILGLLSEAQRSLSQNPDIFGPDTLAEVGIVGPVPTLNATMSGVIDRLVVDGVSVLAVDFKTNAVVPESAEQTPDGILRQMGAYLEALEHVYPDKRIKLAILWTTTGALMPLEHAIVRSVLQQTPTS